MLATPGLRSDERCRPFAHLVGREELAAGEDLDLCPVDRCPLIDHRELGEAIDVVTPQVDAHRRIGSAREHVDDRAAHGELPAMLDLMLTAVPDAHQLTHELGRIQRIAHADHHGLDLGHMRAQALHESPHRRHDHRRHPARLTQSPDRAQPAPHGLDGRTHPLERQRLPGREQFDVISPDEHLEIVDESLRLSRRGHGDDERSALRTFEETGDRDGAGRFGHHEDRVATAEDGGEPRFIGEQRGEFEERHGTSVMGCRTRDAPAATRDRGVDESADATGRARIRNRAASDPICSISSM